jgi:Tfp pilus assembly protein PilE
MLLAAIAYPSYYWYTTKMYQQEAKLPFQFRLSQWQNKLDENTSKLLPITLIATKMVSIYSFLAPTKKVKPV